MSSRWNRLRLVAPVVTMGAALALGGCVNNDISLSITRFVAADVQLAASNQCAFDTTSLALARGTFDVSLAQKFGTGYSANFEVLNNLPEIMTQPIETQAYYVQSFDVILETSGIANGVITGNDLQYSYPVSTTRLAPGESQFFGVQAIAAKFAAPLQAQLLAAQMAKTDTSGAITIHLRPVSTRAEEQQTGAYSSFPIDICAGCLTGGATLRTCSSYKGQTPLSGNVCNFAADESVSCCNNTNGQIICGSQVMAASML